MRTLKLFLIFLLLYGLSYWDKQLYISSIKNDNRQEILRNYFTFYKSPLLENTKDFLEIADTYQLDYRLLVAIAGVESTFERNGNVSDYNPFGYMCGNSPCQFLSFRESIVKVAKTIGTQRTYANFRQSGSILELAKIYNYVSPEDWTRKIQYFMDELK